MSDKPIFGQGRQGDVLTELAPNGGKDLQGKPLDPDDRGRLVLAKGEATGHDHTIDYSRLTDVIETEDEEIVFTVPESAHNVHQEHGPIPLGPGRYIAITQQEYRPQGVRKVVD